MTNAYSKTVLPGTPHPQPCPDCGARLLLGIYHGVFKYKCERYDCDGSAGAHQRGAPLGIPIDKKGKRLRWKLHGLIDPYWDNPFGSHWENATIRQLIYRWWGLWPELVNENGEFHIGYLNHEQLKKAFELMPKFEWYMEKNEIHRKEMIDAQKLPY